MFLFFVCLFVCLSFDLNIACSRNGLLFVLLTVCVHGGSSSRMQGFAEFLVQELHMSDAKLEDLCTTDRYCMYKVGPVLSISVSGNHVILHSNYGYVIF